MNDKTIAEFRTFCDNYIEAAETEWEKTDSPVDLAAATVAKILKMKFNEILSRAVPVKEVEPLAVLAARKGFAYIYTDGYHKRNKFEVTEISIFESITEGGSTSGEYCFHAQSYAEAESKARAYLEGLDDKGGR